jgi:antitoxin HicB
MITARQEVMARRLLFFRGIAVLKVRNREWVAGKLYINFGSFYVGWRIFMVEVKDSKFTVILREEEAGYSAQVAELPGCISQGKSKIEALAHVKEAIKGYLEAFPKELDQLKRKHELVEITV